MERKKVILLAIGVLLAGICAALPFRRPAEESPVTQDAAAEDSPVLLAPAADSVDPSAPPVAAPPREEAIARPSETSVAAASPPREDERRSFSEAAPPSKLAAPQVSSDVAVAPPVLPATDQSSSPPRPRSWRRHRIQDGDTLPKLAQRYLDDPARAAELFDLNRDVLPDPAILPIGAWLRIPAAD